MRLTIIITLYLLCLDCSGQFWPDKAQSLRLLQMNGKFGLVRQYYPNVVVPAIYDQISWLSSSSFLVKKNGFCGIVDSFGVVKIKPDTYTWAYSTTEIEPGKTLIQLSILSSNQFEKKLLTDQNGNILARNFHQVTEKRGDLMIVTVSSDDSIQRNLFFTKNDSAIDYKHGLLKTNGEWIVKPENREFRFMNDYCIAAGHNISNNRVAKLSLLNRKGKVIVDNYSLSYNYKEENSDSLKRLNRFRIQDDEFLWVIDFMGKVLTKTPRKYPELRTAFDSAANKVRPAFDSVSKKLAGKIKGKWTTVPVYSSSGTTFFYAISKHSEKKALDIYNMAGEFLASTNFDGITTFTEIKPNKKLEPDKELIFGWIQGEYFLLNEKFESISPPIHKPLDIIYSKGDVSLFLFHSDRSYYGVMNQAGKILINPSQDSYPAYEINNLIFIRTSGKDSYYVYNLDGKLLFTDAYSVKMSVINPDILYVVRDKWESATSWYKRESAYSLKNFEFIIDGQTHGSFDENFKHKIVKTNKHNGYSVFNKNLELLSTDLFKTIEEDSFALVMTTLNNKKQILGINQNKLSEKYDTLFNSCRSCQNKMYVVKNNGKYGLINYEAKTILNCEWDSVMFFGKIAAVRSGHKFYITDTNYVLQKNIPIETIKLDCRGSGVTYKTNNKWHLVDGKPVDGLEFDEAVFECTHNDLISIKDSGKYGIYSRLKKMWILNPTFDNEVNITSKYSSVKYNYFTKKNNKKYFIDPLRKSVFKTGFDFIEPMQLMVEGFNPLLENHLVNNGGKTSISASKGAKLDTVVNGKFGVADSKGKLLHAINGDHVVTLIDRNYGNEYDDYANCLQHNILGFLWNIGGTMQEYISFAPDSIDQIYYTEDGNEHTIRIGLNPIYDKKISGGKFGIVGPNGKEILSVIYDNIVFMHKKTGRSDEYYLQRKNYSEFVYGNDLWDILALYPVFIQKNNKWGAADLTGKIILPVMYDTIADASFLKENTIRVWKNGLYGFYDLFGKVLLPTEYTNELYYNIPSEYKKSTAFAIMQKHGSTKNTSFVRKIEILEVNQAGEEKLVVKDDTIHLKYFSGGQLGIFRPEDFKTLLPAEYDDIRTMHWEDDSTKKIRDLTFSVTRNPLSGNYVTNSQEAIFFEIKKSDTWGIYALNRGIVIKPQYEDIEVVYMVIKNRGYNFSTGKNNKTNELGPAVGFKFKQGGKWGVLNLDGKIILKAEYDSIDFTEQHRYKATVAGKTFLFETNAQPVESSK